MLGGISIWQLLIVLLIVVLVFGTKKLKNMGKDMGEAVKGFKDGLKDESDGSETVEEAVKNTKVESVESKSSDKVS